MSSLTEVSSSADLARVTTRRFAPLRPGESQVLVDERAAARAAGYAQGWAHGRRDAEAAETDQRLRDDESRRRLEQALAAETQHALDALENAERQAAARTAPVVDDIADTVLAAAVQLAQAVLGAELSVLDDAGALALRRALAPLPDDGRVVVRMNPSDLEIVRAARATDGPSDDVERIEGHEVELVADSSLGRGEAVADHGAARVDARIDAALRRAVTAAGLLTDQDAR